MNIENLMEGVLLKGCHKGIMFMNIENLMEGVLLKDCHKGIMIIECSL